MPIGPVSPKDMGRAGRGSYGKGVSKGKMTASAKAYPTSNVKVVKPVKAVKVTKRVPAAKKAVDKAGAEGPKKAVKTKLTPAQKAKVQQNYAKNYKGSRKLVTLSDGREWTSYGLRN